MKRLLAAVFFAPLLAVPAWADQKVDEAYAKALEQLAKGKPEEALKTMQKLVGSVPGPEAYLAQGRVQERISSLDEAGAAYAKGADLGQGPAKADAMAAHAFYLFRTGPGKAALARSEQAVQVAATPASLAVLARIQARVDPAKAAATAEKAVAAGANSALAYDAQGAALLASGKPADASAAFQKALGLDPKLTRARVSLSEALLVQGKAADAVAEAKKAVAEDDNYAEAHGALGAAIITQDVKNGWGEAIAAAQNGAFKNAKSAPIQMVVGKIFEASGQFDQATNAYRKAAELDPEFGPALAALVNAQFRKGDLKGALEGARKLAAANPGSGDVQLLFGELLLRNKDFENAVAPLEAAVKLVPGTANAHAYLARAYHQTGRIKEALAPYAKAAELDPQNVDLRSDYGLVLGMNGQLPQAAEELKKVVATPGYKNTAGFTNLGWVYRNIEPPRNDESVTAYKKALELDAKNGQAALGLAWAHSGAKRYDEAIAACTLAMQIDTAMAPACQQSIAWSYFFKKDFVKSREALTAGEKAGAGNARLDSILDRIEKAGPGAGMATEEALAEAEKARDEQRRQQAALEQLDRQIRDASPATRIRGVRDLARVLGGDATPTLAWMLYNDRSTDVRIVVAQTLGTLGGAAKKACPQLQAIANDQIIPDPGANPAQVEEELRRLNLQKACREAVAKACR